MESSKTGLEKGDEITLNNAVKQSERTLEKRGQFFSYLICLFVIYSLKEALTVQ